MEGLPPTNMASAQAPLMWLGIYEKKMVGWMPILLKHFAWIFFFEI